MKNLLSKLGETLIISVITSMGAIGMLNVMAYEPQIMLAPPQQKTSDFSARQYAENHPFGKIAGYLSYPGAKLGRYEHNKRVDGWNARQLGIKKKD
ncbi:hypothetical protein A3K73_04000 [Candidatus Pacearchaeota archaeon RBG_13_36_9]|nr:MAG: hypothetical protein A3K73_04000 [Candidatus Pacearchaeota archaeon RBG_13_36_9]